MRSTRLRRVHHSDDALRTVDATAAQQTLLLVLAAALASNVHRGWLRSRADLSPSSATHDGYDIHRKPRLTDPGSTRGTLLCRREARQKRRRGGDNQSMTDRFCEWPSDRRGERPYRGKGRWCHSGASNQSERGREPGSEG